MEKETIIFLHGMVGNKNAFKKEIEKLETHYHCISYDFYDSEVSSGGSDPLSIELFLKQLDSKYRKAGIKKAHLCALSFGCIIAAAFARKFPEKVTSLTFVGGYLCNGPSKFIDTVTKLLEEKHKFDHPTWLRQCARLLNPNIACVTEDSEAIFLNYSLQMDPDLFVQALRLHLGYDSKAVLAGINIPILWVMGKEDHLYKGTLVNLKDCIPHVVYKEIKNAGHVAHIHKHQQFMSMFRSFLRTTASRRLLIVKRVTYV
ncbi:alpha/beta fold hydrolase [Anaerobacillus sp. MEB173]|uniref:alpha/beta fold hydrolase n=1 Tax=Anaerobacillus sp. MEB173 TaxID=3383345 RepID=UPI003F9372E8